MTTQELGLVPDDDQRELAKAVRDLLARRSDHRAAMESADGFDRELWSTLTGLIDGVGPAELHLVLEELGYALTPSPLAATAVCAELVDLGTGDVATVATGDVTWDGALRGSATRVAWGAQADVLLVVAQHDDGTGVFRVDPDATGLTVTSLTPLDPTTPFARVDLDGVAAEAVAVDAADALAPAARASTLTTLALQVGCAQRGLDMTVEYAKQREQFGRAIGSFQALKHRMADMAVLVQMARSGAWAAVQAHLAGGPDADRMIDSAARYCRDAALQVAAETVQLHGGIAITWEHDAHLILKRAQVLART